MTALTVVALRLGGERHRADDLTARIGQKGFSSSGNDGMAESLARIYFVDGIQDAWHLGEGTAETLRPCDGVF